MDEPADAEALLIEDGTVAAVGSRDEVLALASNEVEVMDIGHNVAYPGSSTPTPTGSGTASTAGSRRHRQPWKLQGILESMHIER